MGILNFEFAKIVGMTLFHSIWQATLIALLMSLALSNLNREKSKVRYKVSVLALFSLFLVTIATFIYYFNSSAIKPMDRAGAIISPLPYEKIIVMGNEYSVFARINDLLLENIHWITSIWALGLLFFIAKIGLGLQATRKLSSSSRSIKDAWILDLFENLKQRAIFTRMIEVKESFRITSPSVIGWIKPCIYLPIGLVNHINPEEAEAILAHELAHIIRNDFLVNIIQSIVESFYYFHPAVWWISANIRSEREHACDDLAIQIIGDKLKYAKSLVHLQEWENHARPGLAMNFASKETPLFDRIKRILNQPKNRHDMKQKVFASLILLSSIIWISATHAPTETEVNFEEIELEEELEIVEMNTDWPDYYFEEIDTVPKASKSTVIELKNGKIKRLEIDGEEISPSEFDQHEELVKELKRERLPEMNPNSFFVFPSQEKIDLSREITRETMDDLLAEMEAKKHEMRPLLEENLAYLFENREHWAEDLREHNEEFREQLDEMGDDLYAFKYKFHDSLKHNFDSLRFHFKNFHFDFDDMANDIKVFVDSLNFKGMIDDTYFYLDTLDWGRLGRDYKIAIDSFDFPDFDNDFYFEYGSNLENTYKRELRKDGLYEKSGNDIKLSPDRLEINGKIQSEEMLEKYKSIYEKKTGTKLLKGSNLHIELDNSSSNSNYKRI